MNRVYDSRNLFGKKDIIGQSIHAIFWVPEALLKALEVGFWATPSLPSVSKEVLGLGLL